ncbi:MAG: ATP-binding protein, partial [Verrucomicrobiota bacterium]
LVEETGLPQNSITHLGLDREGGLWCSLGSGLARVDLAGGLTYYDRRNGLPALVVTKILRHEGSVYLASNSGLFRLRPVAPPAVPQWERVREVTGEMYDLVEHEDDLFAAVQGRVMRIEGETVSTVWDEPDLVWAVVPSVHDPDRIYVAGRGGLGTIERVDGTWREGGAVPGERIYAQSVVEMPDGTVWVGTQGSGVWRFTSEGKGPGWREEARREQFFGEAGLPANAPLNVVSEEGRLSVASYLGTFDFDPASGLFLPREAVDDEMPPIEGWRWDVKVEGPGGSTWGSVYPVEGADDDFNLYYGRQYVEEDGETAWEWIPPGLFEPVGGVLYQYVEEVDGEAVMWVGGWNGLARWELERAPRGRLPPPLEPQVRAVTLEDGRRLFGGVPGAAPPEIEHVRSALHFAFAAPVMGEGLAPQYRTRMRGYEEDWSAWGEASELAFTNLPEGDYVFEVEARTVFGAAVMPAQWGFSVLPPWHRSGWAYLSYAFLAALVVWLIVQWRLLVLRRENERLEALISVRTADLLKSERDLRAARDEANRANRAKSAFLANMSHELRTPLNGILGYAQVLTRDRELSPRNRERVGVLARSGQHLLKLINEVLDLSKIESERFELRPTTIELESLHAAVDGMFGPRLEEKQLQFQTVRGPGLPARVRLDEQKVEQVLFNLLGNAVKFTEEGGVLLRIEHRPGPRLRFTVEDTGRGIPEEALESIFEPFQQTGRGPSAEPGTGLGLAISRRLVEAMGGEIGVESRVGEGSRFWFELPAPVVDEAVAAPRAGEAAEISGYLGPRRRLLVVDDVALDREVVRELLEPLGFAIDEAAEGGAALESIVRRRPDLVFLDMRMAPMDGAETVRRLRALPAGKDLPVVAYSASALNFTREDARALGCDDFVAKPFRWEEL